MSSELIPPDQMASPEEIERRLASPIFPFEGVFREDIRDGYKLYSATFVPLATSFIHPNHPLHHVYCAAVEPQMEWIDTHTCWHTHEPMPDRVKLPPGDEWAQGVNRVWSTEIISAPPMKPKGE